MRDCVNIDSGRANSGVYTWVDWEVTPDVIADGLHLPFKDGSVDCVVAKHFWEHVPKFAFLDEVKRVLKQGGYFCAILPNYKHLGDKFYWRDPTHRWAAWPEMLETPYAGWEIVQFNRLGKWGYRWAFDIVARKK